MGGRRGRGTAGGDGGTLKAAQSSPGNLCTRSQESIDGQSKNKVATFSCETRTKRSKRELFYLVSSSFFPLPPLHPPFSNYLSLYNTAPECAGVDESFCLLPQSETLKKEKKRKKKVKEAFQCHLGKWGRCALDGSPPVLAPWCGAGTGGKEQLPRLPFWCWLLPSLRRARRAGLCTRRGGRPRASAKS